MISEAGTNDPVVIMAHQPKHFDIAVENNVELMVCGHTHGGQMWPFGYLVKLVYKKYWKGLVFEKNSTLYTLVGTNTWGPPIRFGTTSEILVVDMVKEK